MCTRSDTHVRVRLGARILTHEAVSAGGAAGDGVAHGAGVATVALEGTVLTPRPSRTGCKAREVCSAH